MLYFNLLNSSLHLHFSSTFLKIEEDYVDKILKCKPCLPYWWLVSIVLMCFVGGVQFVQVLEVPSGKELKKNNRMKVHFISNVKFFWSSAPNIFPIQLLHLKIYPFLIQHKNVRQKESQHLPIVLFCLVEHKIDW